MVVFGVGFSSSKFSKPFDRIPSPNMTIACLCGLANELSLAAPPTYIVTKQTRHLLIMHMFSTSPHPLEKIHRAVSVPPYT